MQNRKYITVSELNFYLNRIIDAEELLHDIYLMGEVSGVNTVKGNLYCTLKDEDAAIQVCCFGVEKTYLPETGERVLMFGTPDYYVKSGRMSFVAKRIEPFGRGKMFLELELLRKKLEAEGLFEQGSFVYDSPYMSQAVKWYRAFLQYGGIEDIQDYHQNVLESDAFSYSHARAPVYLEP